MRKILAITALAVLGVVGAGTATLSSARACGHGHQPPCPPPTTTTTTTTTPTPTPGAYLSDDFNGTAGAAPDATKWVNIDGLYLGNMSCSKAANAFLDGAGHLVLRATRASSGWCSQNGAPYAGASIGTYQYQTGWPPKNVKASWPVPFAYEVRFRCAPVDGAWEGPGWLQNVDRTTSQGLWELDGGESRASVPTTVGLNQHRWVNGADTLPENAGLSTTDCRTNWHTVRVEALSGGGTRYYVDGVFVTTHSGVGGTFGVLLHNEIADASSWGAGGKQPASSSTGPWDMLVDYVRVTAL